MDLVLLDIRVPREAENSPEAAAQMLASLSKVTKSPRLLNKLFGSTPVHLSLEIATLSGQIHFIIVCPKHLEVFVKSQISATHPDCVIQEIPDYLPDRFVVAPIKQSAPAYFPLRDYADYKTVDPQLPLLGVMAKAETAEMAGVQFVISPPNPAVYRNAQKYITPTFESSPEGKSVRELPPEEKQIIKDKVSHPLVDVSMRLMASNKDLVSNMLGAISVLNRPDGNSLVPAKLPLFGKDKLLAAVLTRTPRQVRSTLNVMELASLWHLPGVQTKIGSVAWAASIPASEPPENLPLEDKDNINFFAQTNFKNKTVRFGIKTADRLRHMYILGKSGTGKSTLLENMAIDDFKKNRGLAFIDPHGDSIENLLNYIPKNRINDVVYFNPADAAAPININILEVENSQSRELVVSGIISVFQKLYGKNWGPRLQYIFRNALLTLTENPGSTLPDVVKIFADAKYRHSLYPQITNKQLLNFWQNEFDNLTEDTRLEYTYPILNKVGQFVNSPLIQNVISKPRSSINLAKIMDEGKILLANLSQGRLGEDNATLLGAMLVTKFEQAAMNRLDTKATERRDFFLYVDEFQNFATLSFVKILSEARKFHLGLILANQYMAQVPEEIQKAIFGNVGTIVAFNMGAEDAHAMAYEFSPVFHEASLVGLDQHQIVVKMTIDGTLSRPFTAYTLPPFKSVNQNRPKVLEQSHQRHNL